MPGKYAMIPIGKGLYRINVPRSAITGRYKTERRKSMTPEQYKLMLDMAQTSTPTLEEYQEMQAFDSNVEWRLPQGTISNLLELALEKIESAAEHFEEEARKADMADAFFDYASGYAAGMRAAAAWIKGGWGG